MTKSPDAIDRADLARRLRDAAQRVAYETVPSLGLTTAPAATPPSPARTWHPPVDAAPAPAWSAPAPDGVRPLARMASPVEPPPRLAPPSDAARFTVGSDSWQDAVEGLRDLTL